MQEKYILYNTLLVDFFFHKSEFLVNLDIYFYRFHQNGFFKAITKFKS